MAAFNKLTGKLVWKTGDDHAAYATPIAVTGAAKSRSFSSPPRVARRLAETGQELWRVPWKTEFECNICTPLLVDKDQLFVTSGEEVGCALFNLSAATPEIAWESKGRKSVMLNYWANAVVHEGYLYGLSGEFNKKIHFNCVDLKNGQLKWSPENFGKAALTLADGHLFITTKKGELVLVRPNPQKYEEKARVSLLSENRTSPTIAEKRLYLRDREEHLLSGYCREMRGSIEIRFALG